MSHREDSTRVAPLEASAAIALRFDAGTLVIRGASKESAELALPPVCVWDDRTSCHRAPASAYADVVRTLVRSRTPYDDEARAYETLERPLRIERAPRPYQVEACDAWERSGGRGVVVLPTGAGKTHLAVMAIDRKRRSALVVAPTLDLVRQWYDVLVASFGGSVGVVGGGEHMIEALTVTTYDSAYIHMENFGARFGMVVFDECHHLPSDAYALAARSCLAPFRLGLTATPERADGREAVLEALIGKTVYRQDIVDLSGEYLADYEVVRISVALTADERAQYERDRAIYRGFVARMGIRMSQPGGFTEFIKRSAASEDGRRAMEAYRRQRHLAFAASEKLECIERLLDYHRNDRVLLFTQDNATAYEISRRFLLPAITHQTKVTERSAFLKGLADGTLSAIVTSKVLNEGVDVPDANVAVIVSGSGSVREHVQRLGRVLRKKGDKRAVLYELVTGETNETFTSERRREHSAYRGSRC